MRILVVAPHYKFFIKDLTEALAEKKEIENITVLIRYNPLSELARYVPISYFRHVRKYAKGSLVDLKDKPANVDVHLVRVLYLRPDGSNLGLGDKLAKVFENYIEDNGLKFDLIHAHFLWPHGYAAVRLGKEFDVPVVVTAHGYDVYDLPFRDEKWLKKVRYTLENADHIITVSNSNRKILVEKLGVPPEKVSVIPNGFNSKLFYPMDKLVARRKLELPSDKKIILNVASLVPVKGHKYLIEAMGKIVKQRKDVLLVIVGDGPLRKELHQMVNRLGLQDYVLFVGARPHDEIPLWMNAADLFVLPSLSEGNPTVLFEALGVSLPFVGTKVGGIPEIITSESYGLLCEPGNLEDLSEKILIALDREWNKGRIQEYTKQFVWDNIAKRMIHVYRMNLRGKTQ